MRIVLVLPSRRLWRWHARLVAELAGSAELEVRLVSSPPYPLATRAWLALERTVFGRRDAVPIRPEALGAQVAPPLVTPACDLLIDLARLGTGGRIPAALVALRRTGR